MVNAPKSYLLQLSSFPRRHRRQNLRWLIWGLISALVTVFAAWGLV